MSNTIDHIVVDVEIQNPVESLPGRWNDTDKMGVAVAVVYEFKSDRYHVYLEGDVAELRERILRADRVSGFNIYRFDFPVIFGLHGRERKVELLPKTNDILRRIQSALGVDEDRGPFHLMKGWTLDACCKGTFGAGKSANGIEAPKWYQAGQISKVISYCLDDVRLERDLVAFVDREGHVKHESGRVLGLATAVGR
jgi:DEAD/DEAH box helicase domain-containing protein